MKPCWAFDKWELSVNTDGNLRRWLNGVSEQVLESSFINGLRLEIQAELRMLKPTGLGRLMALAQRIEKRNQKLKQNK